MPKDKIQDRLEKNNITADIEDALKHLLTDKFRVTVFGSARTKPDHPAYIQAYQLGKALARENIDVITGGGPGIMEAAAAGHKTVDNETEAYTIGIGIKLPFEQGFNQYIEVQKEFRKFSGRLDQFMVLSNAVVIMDGGIGTCLELFYTWQLTQINHICNIPIIVVGEQWRNLIKWVRDNPLENGFMSPEDMHNIYVVDTNEEIMEVVLETYKNYKEFGKNFCVNSKKYIITD